MSRGCEWILRCTRLTLVYIGANICTHARFGFVTKIMFEKIKA